MYGEQLGLLSLERKSLTFKYSPEALNKGIRRPLLSVSMPTRPQPYRGNVPNTFFDGLLPEGETRRMIAYDLGLSDRDTFGLLKVLGQDCAGALVIVPEEKLPDEEGVPEPITDDQVAERIRHLHIAPLGVDQRIHVSLAGMQEKLLLSRSGKGWGLPVDGAPSTHIIKPESPYLSDSVHNEAFCMRVAHHLGLSVAAVEVRTFDEMPVLVIERYDRSQVPGQKKVLRLHQEDFCQVHALDSQSKYEDGGGPSLLRCTQVLRQWTVWREQFGRLLDLTTLNVLVGNADAHAKNLSLLHYTDGQIQLAPAYDVMSTTYYPKASSSPGMFINGVKDITAVTKDDLIREAVSWGMSQDSAAGRIERVLADIDSAISQAVDDIHPPDKLVEILSTRAQTLGK